MAYKDLQDFINTLEQKKLLKRIKAEVDSELEITEIADRVVKAGGPLLLFEKVKGSDFPLLINTRFTSRPSDSAQNKPGDSFVSTFLYRNVRDSIWYGLFHNGFMDESGLY